MKTQDLWNFTTTWQQAQFEDIFECQHTKNSSWKEGTLLVLKADRNLFSHMILVAEIRKVNMKDVLAHPTHWAHLVRCAASNVDGSLRQTNKAALVCKAGPVSPAEHIPTPSASFIDEVSGHEPGPKTEWQQQNLCTTRLPSKLLKDWIELQSTLSNTITL